MQEEINEIIKKNLPAQVGDILQARLTKAESDAKDLLIRSEELIKEKQKNSYLIAELSKHEQLDKIKLDLDEREQKVSTKERDIRVFEAELKLAESEKRATEMVNLIALAFKSPSYRKTISESDYTQPVYGGQNGMVSGYQRTGGSKTETTDIV